MKPGTYDPETGEIYTPHLDEKGAEVLDPVPMEPPIGYNPQPSLAVQIREMVRSEKLKMEAEAAGVETFEEADDFVIGDDFDPSSPYENEFDPPIAEMLAAGKAEKEQKEEAARRAPPAEKTENKTSNDGKKEDLQPPSQEPKK